jgi:nucleoside-diphosphate-sugar epimerase
MSRYLVTGGAGFIGSNIVEDLLKRGHEVRVVDNLITGKRENIEPFLDKIEFLEEDIRDYETCRRAVSSVDFILHQAALPSVPRSIEDPVQTNDINVNGTLNLLLASNEVKARRFVFASSSAVYGDNPDLPKKEGTEGNPLSPYGLTKLVGEKYCKVFSVIYGLPTVCLRYFNIFGPHQDPTSQYAAVIPAFISKMLEGNKPTIFGDGEQSRDFTFVGNVVEANILATEAENISGEAFNVGCGQKTTVNSLAAKINEILNTDIEPDHDQPRPGDIKHSFADISKAKQGLKFEPLIDFREGLQRTIRWYQERG